MAEKFVVPGEIVAIAEEYVPGKGTYESDGKIIASEAGNLALDTKNRSVSVTPRNPITEPKKKDRVLAAVTDVKSSMAICEILTIEGATRQITGDSEATLHVSSISSQYVETVGSAVRVGDVIRAEVIQSQPSTQLTTVASHLGVVLAHCGRCKSVLKLKDKSLYCEECERYEKRKIADDYGGLPAA